MFSIGERLQLETDVIASLILGAEFPSDLTPHNFQTPNYRELLERFLNECPGRTAGDWIAFGKAHDELKPLLSEILEHGRNLNGELGRYLEALRRNEMPSLDGDAMSNQLNRLETFLKRYVVFPSEHEPVALSLWIAHSWIVEQFPISPILAVVSAEMRSGKTRLLEILQLLVPYPSPQILPSEAVLYTIASQRPPPQFC